MPFGSVTLVPGVDVNRTPTLLRAGISESQLIRFREGLVQKYGGWSRFYSFNVAGVTRDLHAWQDLNDDQHLLIGSTTKLGILTSGSYVDITPRELSTSPNTVDVTTAAGSTTVEIVDADLTAPVTGYDVVMFKTPIIVGGLILTGVYQITQSTGATSYEIEAATAATSSVSNGGTVPVFTTVDGSATVNVAITGHGLVQFDQVTFQTSTTGNGVTLFGSYAVDSVVDANNFTVTVPEQATANGAFSMNGGDPDFLYYITLGPPAAGVGYGLGTYGTGGYGTGDSLTTLTGTQITATDWTSANWGQIALACPQGGAVYQYNPTGGFQSAGMVSTAPPFNTGIFISTSLQILFCYGSTQENQIGIDQDPMLIRWSDLSNYFEFVAKNTNQAGAFRIPIGSVIRSGMAVSNQNLFWTDLDLWAANYSGYPLVFGFNKIGAGAGSISSHSPQQLRNGVYWMGTSNFYSYTGSGVSVVRCPVWDFVFQRLNTTYQQNVRAMPNTPFNEVGWLFPSTDSTSGECDSYVKFNISDPSAPWDYGTISRSAWIDQTVLGAPVSCTSTGILYQQETTNDADGQPMTSSFTTGYFYLDEGEEFVVLDQIMPDMIWGTYDGAQSAQVYITINAINYPGDTPTTYGPYLMTQTTKYITVRIRARQVSMTFQSSDSGSFWRLGRVRYRYQQSAGRR